MITRDVFLYLAKQKRARDVIMGIPFSRRAALRFVAGEDLDTALKVVSGLNEQGMLASLDYLGEDVASADDALKAVADYTAVLERIASSAAESSVSLKLTQMGLNTGVPFCMSCVDKILDLAAQRGKFVQIDMESSDYTDRTLAIFRDLRSRHDNVGIVIQSYLYRSAQDIEDLIPLGAHIRLCKGAYKEPVSVAFARKVDVDRSYIALMERLLSAEARSHGAYLDIATHDPRIIKHAKDFAQRNGIGRDEFEFQMLHGVRRDLQRQLVAEGYRLRIYVPYGQQWYPYFMRRLAERPANIISLVRSVAGEWGN